MSARQRRRTGRTVTLRAAAVAVTALGVLGATLPAQPQPAADAAATAAPAAGPDPAERVRQSEDQAQAAAAASGERVEVAALRQERREVFANPDGSFTAVEHTEPVRTVKDGAWVPVDDTLVRRSDGGWSPKAATVELEFSGGGDGPFARMRKAGREYALTWPGGALPEPHVEGDTATYAEVLPGVDLVARAEVDGLGHLLVVKTPEAARNPALASVELGLRTEGLRLEETDAGALRAVDTAVGGTVFEAARPVMWDSAAVTERAGGQDADQAADGGAAPQGHRSAVRTAALQAAPPASGEPGTEPPAPGDAGLAGPGGGGRTAPVDIEVAPHALTLVPDEELLTGEDTVFPVVIDPVQKTTSRSAWTGVMSGMPSEQDWKYSGSAGVGRCPTDYNPVSCNGVGVRRLLYTMPVSFYKGKQILKATFSARLNHVYWADAKAEPIRLYRIGGKNRTITSSSDWGNTKDDWSDYLMTVDKKISPTSCSSQANLHFEGGELTSEVRAAADGGWNSLSLGLRAEDEGRFGEWKRVCGNTYLSVSYNNPPRQVDHRLMSSNPGGKCTWGAGRPYTEEPPQLRAEARDPDHTSSRTDKVKMQFKVEWTDSAGAAQAYTYDTAYKAPNSGTVFTHDVRDSIPQNTVVYWSARAYDGDAWGDWSWAGDPQRCEFVYDASRPGAPAVTSEQYPDDEVWHHGVGTTGTFTFAPDPDDAISDEDVVEYRYSFDGAPEKTVAAETPGGPASVTWTPMRAGPHWVTVEAYDKADNSSTRAQYEFLVTDGLPAAGQWNLGDEPGTTDAHDESGKNPATAGPAVRFGVPGPGGTADAAARLDGTADAYLDAQNTVLDTDGSYSVSAWVRPASLDRSMAVVSQDGTGEPGFVLGYDAAAGSWAFSVPVTDVNTLGHWTATAGVTAVADQWVLLTGVYDAHASGGPELRIYVNDQLKGTAKRRSHWTSHGALQIGRTLAKSGYRDHFHGDLAEVRAFDRVLPAAQVAELLTVRPERTGYWPLEEAPGGVSANVHAGGQPLTLAGDASVYRPADPLFDIAALVGDGHLELDGAGDHAATAAPPVGGDSSFTVAVRAQLTALDPERTQTVLSLPGTGADRFAVRYQASTGQWELAVAREDAAGAEVTTVTDDQELPDTGGSGQHLAVVYDAFANHLRLYVEGQLAATAHAADDTLWKATGGLQVGRSAMDGGSRYFAGAVDEVRAYRGAADPVTVRRMAQLATQPEL
ncbi:LamG domain-containing protein [Streptomyces sp. TRM 70351]|uniref:LamG domain-containing protein n=1 Tax=Streptomyces sp. TRM 70351 TaxID=3116552 RepID=UPI002E7B7FE9|nr:LamG domain-containing protein [Streptomyces sp. TRM 70351]MEE1930853.1 LamG domain-containing protein [Streptomyces sp. TRM 70351]